MTKGRVYDKSGFMWGVMYKANARCKPHITAMYPRGRDAQMDVNRTNRKWKEQGLGDSHWSVKRFFFYFRGTEIDAYEHEWHRQERYAKKEKS